MRMSSSGLLLLLIGVIAFSAFLNGALPSILSALFSSGAPQPANPTIAPASTHNLPTVGAHATAQAA